MQFVFGSEVDYVEGLQGAGFAVNNPNVVAACGCGSSFQVKDEAEESAAAAPAYALDARDQERDDLGLRPRTT